MVKSDFLKRAQWRGELADQSRARLEGMLNGQGGSGMLVQVSYCSGFAVQNGLIDICLSCPASDCKPSVHLNLSTA